MRGDVTPAARVLWTTGQILARRDLARSCVDIRGTSDIVFGADIGRESETHRIVARVTTAAPAAPHRIVSETVEFDGVKVIVVRTYEPIVPTAQNGFSRSRRQAGTATASCARPSR